MVDGRKGGGSRVQGAMVDFGKFRLSPQLTIRPPSAVKILKIANIIYVTIKLQRRALGTMYSTAETESRMAVNLPMAYPDSEQ